MILLLLICCVGADKDTSPISVDSDETCSLESMTPQAPCDRSDNDTRTCSTCDPETCPSCPPSWICASNDGVTWGWLSNTAECDCIDAEGDLILSDDCATDSG